MLVYIAQEMKRNTIALNSGLKSDINQSPKPCAQKLGADWFQISNTSEH